MGAAGRRAEQQEAEGRLRPSWLSARRAAACFLVSSVASVKPLVASSSGRASPNCVHLPIAPIRTNVASRMEDLLTFFFFSHIHFEKHA